MEWWSAFLVILIGLFFLLALGMPVGFSFLLLNFIFAFIFFGGQAGLHQLIFNIGSSLATFTLLPIPLFILMGEILFHSGVATNMIDAIDKWLGNLPGRLGLLAVAGGVLFSTLTGASMASTAMLGSVLVPEMKKRGYQKPMSLGPILGSGCLAVMVPPSALGVLLGVTGQIPIGRILIAIIIPGLLMAILYAAYIILRCRFQPAIAPGYERGHISLSEKFKAGVLYVLPVGFIVFLVIGLIFLGVTTPSEAAATGAIGVFLLSVFYRRFGWKLVKASVYSTLRITVMIFTIIAGAAAFGQILAASGATRGLVTFVLDLPLSPGWIIISMQVILLFMGTFMEAVTIMMITMPLFMPIINALHVNSVWFAVIMLINIEIGTISPPFGINLFVMKGVTRAEDTSMGDIYWAALPFIGCDLIAMSLIMTFPQIALWLPDVMRQV